MKKLISIAVIAALAAGVRRVLRSGQQHQPASPWTDAPGADDLDVAEDLLDDAAVDDADLDDAAVESDLGPVDAPVQELVDDADRATGETHKP